MEQSESRREKRSVLAVLVGLIALAIGIALGIIWSKYINDYSGLVKQVDELKRNTTKLYADLEEINGKVVENHKAIIKVALDNILQKNGNVDFTSSQIQDIGSGFSVVSLEMKKHLTGIKFSGRIINTQSVRHKNATFMIKVGDKEREFTINMISPGNSTAFRVYVPDVKPEDAQYGEIHFKRSTVVYYVR